MRRRISWVKAALKDFREFPEGVREQITSALRLATRGEKADIAKPMKGVGSGVFEVALAYRGNAYRTVYALQLVKDIWVVHAFQKKSTKGIKTPKIEGDVTMTEELGLVRGSENPFRDVGLPDADTKLIKADLAAEVIGVLRERRLTGAAAAKIA